MKQPIVMTPRDGVMHFDPPTNEDPDCSSCGEDNEPCPKSERPCGHHCNHSWSHDACCWCGKEWTGDEETT